MLTFLEEVMDEYHRRRFSDVITIEWSAGERESHLDAVAAMLSQSRRRAMYEVIGLAQGSKIALIDLPKVNDAFSLNKGLYKNCVKKAGSSDVLDVGEVLEVWRKSDANKRGASSMREHYRDVIPIVVAAFIVAQDSRLSLDAALETTNKALARSSIKYKPDQETLRTWLDRLNRVEGTGFPQVQGFAAGKAGRPKSSKNAKNSPHKPA